MHKILFVCHGNICRSPMAEFVLKDLVHRRGLDDQFLIQSCATSTEELGSPVYPPIRDLLAKHGISCAGKTAVQLRRSDYEKYDLLVMMDTWNVRNAMRILGKDPDRKVKKLLDFTRDGGDVEDPWYTERYIEVYETILAGCEALLEFLIKN